MPASNRAVQRKLREAIAEHTLSGDEEAFRQALLWLLHDGNRPDLVFIAFSAVHISNALDCGLSEVRNKIAGGN